MSDFFNHFRDPNKQLIDVEQTLLDIASEVQHQIQTLFDNTDLIPLDSPLAEYTMHDGLKVVRDYIFHGETGVAFEHLVYMIGDAEIDISDTHKKQLEEIKRIFGSGVHDLPWQSESL